MLLLQQMVLSSASGVSYAETLNAVSNKTVILRTDTSAATNGQTVTTTPWVNAGSSTLSATGAATWQTNILAGQRGILADGNENISAPKNYSELFAGIDYTFFAVEQRTGTQGGNTGSLRYRNSCLFQVNTQAGVSFEVSSRQFAVFTHDGTFRMGLSTFSFTDGVPYVIAVRVSTDGSVRFNYMGSISTLPAASMATPSSWPINEVLLNDRTTGAGTNYAFEYIVSSVAVTDTVMDEMVLGLRSKWGI